MVIVQPGDDFLADTREVRDVVGRERIEHQRPHGLNVTGSEGNNGGHTGLGQVGDGDARVEMRLPLEI